MNKTIKNIVFYKFWDPTREETIQQACIFYADGTVKNVLYETGKELANEIAKEEKIKTQAEFTSLINVKRIYTLSGAEFERRFKEFLGTGVALVPTTSATPAVITQTGGIPAKTNGTPLATTKQKTTSNGTTGAAKQIIVPPVPGNGTNNTTGAKTTSATGDTNKPRTTKKDKKKNKKKKKKSSGKVKGFFSKLWVKVTAFILAGTMLFTGGFFLGRNTKSGNIINNNINTETKNENEPQDQTYLNLINQSTNKDQKAVMTHQGQNLDVFNRDFAAAHLEEGKNVKASLTWDEMMALNLAYNTYSREQIRIMFNGAEVNAKALSTNYRNATLQLMGAYVISTRENPVNSQTFLTNPEHQAFVEKYNELFLKMKETTGNEQVAAINAFYAELNKDFPITPEVREEGISHADGRAKVEAYKVAVTPMVMASEIMFQNVSGVDHTMSDKTIAYFNDLGLCNVVDAQFERLETITLTAETDDTQPLYTEFRDAKIMELIYEGNYPTDDVHRDLSQLDAFKKWVNGHFEIVDGVNTGKVVPNPTTTNTATSATFTNDRDKAVSQAETGAVADAEAKVNAELEAQNIAAKKKAEEAEKQSATTKKEVKEDTAEMQTQIDNANNTINNGGTINEGDFGDHNVDFDTEYEDGNGNLDSSVTDITIDGTGAKTENDLPDPNQSGAIFDGQVVDNSGIYEYEELYQPMSNEDIVNGYIANLEGQGATETVKVYQK